MGTEMDGWRREERSRGGAERGAEYVAHLLGRGGCPETGYWGLFPTASPENNSDCTLTQNGRNVTHAML